MSEYLIKELRDLAVVERLLSASSKRVLEHSSVFQLKNGVEWNGCCTCRSCFFLIITVFIIVYFIVHWDHIAYKSSPFSRGRAPAKHRREDGSFGLGIHSCMHTAHA